MKTYRIAVLVLLVLAVSGRASTLREQLALAQKDEDTYAQIELIQRILQAEPKDAELHESLGDLWLSVGDYDMAEQMINAWPDAPEYVRVSDLASVLYHRDDKKAEAVKMLEDYHAKAADDLEITRQLAEYLNGMGNFPRVVTVLDRAPGVSADADLLVTRAIARCQLQDFSSAFADYTAAVKADPEASVVKNNQAAFDRVHAALDGINASNAALAKDPKNLPALLSRAYWYYYTGYAKDAALADAETAHRLAPASVTGILLYAEIANAAGKLSSADALKELLTNVSKPLPSLEVLEQILRADLKLLINPKDTTMLAARGFVLNDKAEQYLLGLRDMDALLALDPNNIPARLEKIYAYVKLTNPDAATTEFHLLEGLHPKPLQLAFACSYLCDAAFSVSHLDIALDYANRAVQAAPYAQFYKQRAAIYHRLNREADAKADIARAVALEKKSKR